MENFTPVSGLIGGMLIGASAALFLMLNGRIAGISGILGGALEQGSADGAWRYAFLAGLVAAPAAWAAFIPVTVEIEASAPLLIAAGLLVGFGTRLGSGCTSGHGVCGISRLSFRSIAATATFMAFGFLTVFVMRHVIGG
ncbi:MAG: YeeE/YedE family protein [Alphaproteobacteria bacterium]|nr:YeeE/YedE family protein [Alphaproteobacteria bacterium]MDX5416337.1 YeeE/YedE family protein [Alphaproteobacteria bacterium]MDX5493686.1 YeeE/YedE family protein [Alphaproteobacteria bacterium]